MKVKCPSCGASMSLEVLIAHDDARAALVELAGISDELVRGCLKYLTLFRPSEKDLTFARVAKLVGELAPMMRAGVINRNRQEHPAPKEAWVWAFARCVEARDMGKLKTPLTSHGFLLENITFWSPEKTAGTAVAQTAGAVSLPGHTHPAADSKLRQGVASLAQWAADDWLRQEIAAGFAAMAAMGIKGRPAAQDMAAVAALWQARIAEHLQLHNGNPVAEFDRWRIQTAFKALQDVDEWPNAAELIRNLPPRMIPRKMLEAPPPDRAKQRAHMEKLKQNLKGKQND